MEACRKRYSFNRMVTMVSMYLFDVHQKWDHSTRMDRPLFYPEFSKFYRRV